MRALVGASQPPGRSGLPGDIVVAVRRELGKITCVGAASRSQAIALAEESGDDDDDDNSVVVVLAAAR